MASGQGHARRFAYPGTLTVAGEMLRMDVPHPTAGEGARLCCSTGGRIPWLLLMLGSEGLMKASKALPGSVQILIVGTPVTSMVTVGWGREKGCRLLHFVALHLRHCLSSLIHLFLIIC